MKKIIYRSAIIIFLILVSSIVYLSVIGLETNRFNNQIINEFKKSNPKIEIKLKKIVIKLNPIKFQIKIKTLGPVIKSNNDVIEIESIKTNIFLNSMFKEKLLIKNLQISTKAIEIKKLISFARTLHKSTELLILQNFIKDGYLIANINLEFDQNGNIKDNFQAKGFIKNAKLELLNKNKLEKINLIFDINKNTTQLQEIYLSYNDLNFVFNKLIVKNINNEFLVNGAIDNKNFILEEKNIQKFLTNKFFDIKKINFSSKNLFSLKINKKFKIEDFKLNSKIKLNELLLLNNITLKDFFPKIKKETFLRDHDLEIDYTKNFMKIKGFGNIFLQNNKDTIKYDIKKDDKELNFNTFIEINDNPFLLNFLNFEKNDNTKLQMNIVGTKFKNNHITIKSASINEDKNKIQIKNLILDEDYKLLKLNKILFDYLDKEKQKNIYTIKNDKDNYTLKAKTINANNILDSLINSDDKKSILNAFKDKITFDILIDNVRLDNEFKINNLNGKIVFDNNEVTDANLSGLFSDSKKIKFSVKSLDNEKISIFTSDKAKPFVKRYKFIKGFDEGSLDFYSVKKGDKSNSTLKIYDFKIKELPALTKLLTLASLQGIADLLSGEGIRFNEFEMNFSNQRSLMKIDELFATGPAISILMEGYSEKNKLISLKGTLVPATTINKVISSIPILGQILVGSKTGEGVFGVSFKIKGSPKKLETSVNPIKTLTPRFITRFLEKIKKN